MTRFTMLQTVTYKGVTYTSGQTYQTRSRDWKEMSKTANQVSKTATKGH